MQATSSTSPLKSRAHLRKKISLTNLITSMSDFHDSDRANPSLGLRATRGGDSGTSAAVPSSLDPLLVDAFSRLPVEEKSSEARANPNLGLRAVSGEGEIHFNTGIKSSFAGSISIQPGLIATPSKDLADQPARFRQAVEALPSSIQREIIDLMAVSTNNISIEVDASAGIASIHNHCNGLLSTMKATWDVSASEKSIFQSKCSPPREENASTKLAVGAAGVPVSETGGIVFDSTPGNALYLQNQAFQDVVANVPKPIQDRVDSLLSDENNHVSLDANLSEGKVVIICKNGPKTSITKASWNPGFSVDHQYVPDEFESKSLSAHKNAAVAAGQQNVPMSSVAGVVHSLTPGLPASAQLPDCQSAYNFLPKTLQERVSEMLLESNNHVYIDLNSTAGKAAIICENGLQTSTLKASWNTSAQLGSTSKAGIERIGRVIGSAHQGPRLVVRGDEAVNPEDRADPRTGLRKVF